MRSSDRAEVDVKDNRLSTASTEVQYVQVKQSTRVTRESGGNELPSLNCSKTIAIVNRAFYYKKSQRERTEKKMSLYREKKI